MIHADIRKQIDRHFAKSLAPSEEQAMRAHLPDCKTCRAHYERHLLFAELVPSPRDRKNRLAAGLGLRLPREARWRSLFHPSLALGFAAVATLALVCWPRPPQFIARGAAKMSAPASTKAELHGYRIVAGKATPLGTRIGDNDELAFAYTNPLALPFLLVFAADEQGHVYWYYPAWNDAQKNPAAVPIQQTTAPIELSAAIRNRLVSDKLRLYAVFGKRAWSVKEIEHFAPRADQETLPIADVEQQSWLLQVDHSGTNE